MAVHLTRIRTKQQRKKKMKQKKKKKEEKIRLYIAGRSNWLATFHEQQQITGYTCVDQFYFTLKTQQKKSHRVSEKLIQSEWNTIQYTVYPYRYNKQCDKCNIKQRRTMIRTRHQEIL